MPSRTLSPLISTTVTTMLPSMTMLSFFFRDKTSIGDFLSMNLCFRSVLQPDPHQAGFAMMKATGESNG
jgi:hypothetical protein